MYRPLRSAAAQAGKSVLILDSGSHYGGVSSTLSLDDLRAWSKQPRGSNELGAKHVSCAAEQTSCEAASSTERCGIPLRSMDSVFTRVELIEVHPELLGSSRDYSLDLVHQVPGCTCLCTFCVASVREGDTVIRRLVPDASRMGSCCQFHLSLDDLFGLS